MIDVRFQPMQTRPAWPKERGRHYARSPFKCASMLDDLERELGFLKATDIVIESGHERHQIRNDGWPRSGVTPTHHDVRLFFNCKHGSLRYECNRFDSWQANLRAIGLWLQRQRKAIEEWGIGTGGEAYRGFAALPAGSGIQAGGVTLHDHARLIITSAGYTAQDADVMSVSKGGEALSYWFRLAAKKCHPDTGGSAAAMDAITKARDAIEKGNG